MNTNFNLSRFGYVLHEAEKRAINQSFDTLVAAFIDKNPMSASVSNSFRLGEANPFHTNV